MARMSLMKRFKSPLLDRFAIKLSPLAVVIHGEDHDVCDEMMLSAIGI